MLRFHKHQSIENGSSGRPGNGTAKRNLPSGKRNPGFGTSNKGTINSGPNSINKSPSFKSSKDENTWMVAARIVIRLYSRPKHTKKVDEEGDRRMCKIFHVLPLDWNVKLMAERASRVD